MRCGKVHEVSIGYDVRNSKGHCAKSDIDSENDTDSLGSHSWPKLLAFRVDDGIVSKISVNVPMLYLGRLLSTALDCSRVNMCAQGNDNAYPLLVENCKIA